jgi:ATP-dependent Clp endopeptidase proteolytic subunit ClpP
VKEPKKYFQLTQKEDTADLYIFGDIEKWAYEPAGETSGVTIVNQLKALKATSINVHINSYGGDVSEGLAIYNTLREHPAQITTICDGFACSAASVVFMAGDKRVMSPASLLMIHNAWTIAMGNASALRKTADDIETITQASVEAYKRTATISEEEIKALMDAETWILPANAVAWGFATDIDDDDEDDDEPKQSAFGMIMQKLISVPASLECETAPMEIAEDSIKALADRISGNLMERLMEPDTPAAKKSGWDTYFK